MNLKDCYTAFGGDYEEVMSRPVSYTHLDVYKRQY